MIGAFVPDYFLNPVWNQWKFIIGGNQYHLADFIYLAGGHAVVFILGLLPLVLCQRMGKFRHPYYGLFVPALIVMIAYFLAQVFIDLYLFVPAVSNFMVKYIPENVFTIIRTVLAYVAVGLPAWFILVCFFAIIYNVNYPGEYEDIYVKRAARIKAYKDLDERIAYKERFYEDYRLGNWDSMMIDLHFASIEGESNEPIPDDAYEFMRYLNGRNEDHIRQAIFDKYREEGRYSDIRKIYHRTFDLEDNISRGAKIRLGREPKKKIVPKPAPIPPYVPPLAHSAARPKDKTDKLWGPDDIQ